MADDIVFYFDFISHNAFLAWTQIRRLAADHERRVDPVPVLFAGLLEAHGQRGPAEIQAKREWMIRDVLRKAAILDLPLAPPPSHPFNPLLALRLVSQPLEAAARMRIIDRLFRAAWCESRSLEDAHVIAEFLAELNLDGEALLAACGDPAIKQALRAQTDDAIAAGVFGVPTMRVGDELFWGYDDLKHLELYLRGEDPLPRAALADWYAIRPSAVRRQR